MRVKKTFEGPDGTLSIDAEFSPAEVEVILEAGLSTLYQNGALPFVKIKMGDRAKLAEYKGTEN